MGNKKYIYSKEHGKMMLVGKDGQLIDEPSKTENFRAKILSLSFWRNDKISGNGFKPHYNKDLGGWVATRRDFEEKCKANGLVCAGDAPPPKQVEDIEVPESKFNDDDIKEIKEKDGVNLSDSDANYLKTL